MDWRDPGTRVRLAKWHLWGSLALGVAFTALVARDNYERVLMGVSWYAITITAADVLLGADIRQQQEPDE